MKKLIYIMKCIFVEKFEGFISDDSMDWNRETYDQKSNVKDEQLNIISNWTSSVKQGQGNMGIFNDMSFMGTPSQQHHWCQAWWCWRG